MTVCKARNICLIFVMAIFMSGCAKVPVVNLFLAGDKNVVYKDTKSCLPRRIKRVLNHTSRKFGKVTVTSTDRTIAENRRVGGASNSYHLRCQAADFTVNADKRKVTNFLKNHKSVGGYSSYTRHYHIDTGPRRTW